MCGCRLVLKITSATQGTQINSDLFAAVPDNTDLLTRPVAVPLSTTTAYAAVPGNQFAWSTNANVPVSTVFTRYLNRESNGTEIGGTPIGDLNGDGYSDYLMTFERHAEVCYSRGVIGFDCYLMEDDTPAKYKPPVPPQQGSYPRSVMLITPTITPDPTTGLFSVYSVLTVGHANDHNIPEIIYRRGDSNGTTPSNVCSVCTIHDGMRSCKDWTGPAIRGSFNETQIYGPPGPNQAPTFTSINWPTAGTLTGDFTGHGGTEILFYCNSTDAAVCPEGFGWQLYRPNVSAPIDRLVQVVNGIGNTTKIDYQPMGAPVTTGATPIYVQQPTDGKTVSYPLHTIADGGRMLVSALHVDRGDGAFLTSTYQYEGLATDVTGRGEQGYAQGFPYTGMELGHTITSSSGCLLEQSGSTLAELIVGTSVYPYAQTSAQTTHVDLNCKSLLPLTTNTINAIDNYGDVTSSTSTTVDQVSGNQYTTATSNTPLVMLNPYVVGSPIYISVTKTAPTAGGQLSSITRKTQFDYYGQSQTPICTPTNVSGQTLTGAAGLLKDQIISSCNIFKNSSILIGFVR